MTFTRRAGLLAAAAAVALTATACAGGSTTGSAAGGSSAPAAADSFPVTVENIYGNTVVPAQPTRVVSLSWVNADAVLALDVVPVGMPLETWGNNENGSTDWKDAKLAELGAAIGTDKAPKQYSEADGVNFEEIAALTPDLIVAAYSGLTEEEYTKLSKIAPVVGPLAPNYTASWRDTTTAIGKALGKSTAAEAVVADVDAQFKATAAANPVLKDSTFIAGNLEPDTGGINIYAGGDNRPRFLADLGMTEAPVVAENAKDGEFFFNWAAERGNELESDVFFTWLPEGNTSKDVEEDPLMGQIPAVKGGGLVATDDTMLTLAVSASSPLSLPWALKEFTPMLVEGAQKAQDAK